MIIKFGLTTTWQQSNDQFARLDSQLLARIVALWDLRNDVSARMADESRGNAGFFIDRRFKRKHRQHVTDGFLDLVDALAAPRPDRWTHIVNRRNAGALEPFLECQIEIRCIDSDKKCWALFEHAIPQATANTENFTKAF